MVELVMIILAGGYPVITHIPFQNMDACSKAKESYVLEYSEFMKRGSFRCVNTVSGEVKK